MMKNNNSTSVVEGVSFQNCKILFTINMAMRKTVLTQGYKIPLSVF